MTYLIDPIDWEKLFNPGLDTSAKKPKPVKGEEYVNKVQVFQLPSSLAWDLPVDKLKAFLGHDMAQSGCSNFNGNCCPEVKTSQRGWRRCFKGDYVVKDATGYVGLVPEDVFKERYSKPAPPVVPKDYGYQIGSLRSVEEELILIRSYLAGMVDQQRLTSNRLGDELAKLKADDPLKREKAAYRATVDLIATEAENLAGDVDDAKATVARVANALRG